METRITETAILEDLLAAFQRVTPFRAELERPDIEWNIDNGRHPDALLRFRLPNGRTIGPLAIEVKPRLDRANIGQLVLETTKTTLPTVVATRYVNPKLAETLVKRNIPFIDTAGNAFLNMDDVFVLVTGRKTPRLKIARPPTRAFRAAGLKLILALLDDQALLNLPYRHIADTTGVALGTITNVFTDLEELGYLQTVGDLRRLRKFEDLVHKWADAYIEKMRGKLVIGRYTATNLEQLAYQDIEQLEAWWGGEVAAAKFTQYLKPETMTLYVRPPAGRVQATFGLKADPRGKVELLEAFWEPRRKLAHENCAPPIVVYADLLAIGDDRTLETARMLYEKYIAIHRR